MILKAISSTSELESSLIGFAGSDSISHDGEGIKERQDGEMGGGRRLLEENDYFKYFRQKGAINLGAAIIRGNTVHCEARLTYPVFILILALNFWVSFAVYYDIVLRALLPSIAIKIMEGFGIFQQQKKVKKLTVMIKKMILMTMAYFSA